MVTKISNRVRKLNSFKVWSSITGIALTIALVLTFLPVQATVNIDGILSIGIRSASANPDWLSGYDYRIQIDNTENGGGTKADYAINLEAFYNCAPVETNGILTRSPSGGIFAVRYSGTHDRTYFSYYASTGAGNGQIKLKWWDADDTSLSNTAVTLWSDWSYGSEDVLGDDHGSPSILILQHQTGGNSSHNGKILVAAAEHGSETANKGRLQTRRSTYAEFDNSGSLDTTFDSAVPIETVGASYATLIETSDGTIWLFYRVSDSTPSGNSDATFYYRTSTDAGASWSSRTMLTDGDTGTDLAIYCLFYPNDTGSRIYLCFNLMVYDDPESGTWRMQDVYFAYYDVSETKWNKINGTDLTLPIKASTADKVIDTTTWGNWLLGSETYCNNSGSADSFILVKYTARSSGTAANLVLKSRASGYAKVAVYANDGGEPGDLLIANNSQQAIVSGWNTLSLGSTVGITQGTDYWLAINTNVASGYLYGADSTATSRYKTGQTFSTFSFPNPAGAGFSSSTTDKAMQLYPSTVIMSTIDDWTWIVDVMDDGNGNPYMLSVNQQGRAEWTVGDSFPPSWWDGSGYILRHYYTESTWTTDNTGIHSDKFGDSHYPTCAQFEDGDVDTIYTGVYDGGDNTQLQCYGKNGSWTKTIDITEASPGDHFRPMRVMNGAGSFKLLWSYSERYAGWGPGEWESMLFAYPGFSNSKYIACEKQCRTDFGDLTFTQGDGTTLQPSASSGKPWIQEKTDSWRAILWIKVGTIPASGGTLSNYCYMGKTDSTNDNSQVVMDAQFLACDHFNSSLDSDKWTTRQGSISTNAGNLELVGIDPSNYGILDQKTANYPAFTYAEWRARVKSSDTTVGCWAGLRKDNDASNRGGMVAGDSSTANRVQCQSKVDNSNYTYTDSNSWDTANWHVWKVTWKSGENKFYIDNYLGSTATQKASMGFTLMVTHNTNVSSTANVLTFWEGTSASGTEYADWIFARPWTDPEPITETYGSEETQSIEITNSPDSNDFGILQVNTTGNTAINYFQIENTGNCAVDVTIQGTDATGGDDIWDLDDTGAPGENIYALWAGLDDVDDLFDVIVRETETYNTLVSDLAEDATQDWGLKIYMPTSLSGYDTQQMTATITLVVSAS